ncbi:class I SAM-dependent methyltransferase [Prosthecochloris sp. GSB1]|uniref:class I SAM-dependent methyltransferase n=1 Tax=Prosthecochloris sp. GSB1 TaxID=281093 RepID=UPI00142D30B7|nr:class I SAM-dependent methyltransferase [Prosthecochloris sp. GSB1]
MTQDRFNESYSRGEIPCDFGRVDVNLVERRSLSVGAALDIGCGTGGNAIWLARKRFRATGVDISSLAIETACEKSEREGGRVQVSGGRFSRFGNSVTFLCLRFRPGLFPLAWPSRAAR